MTQLHGPEELLKQVREYRKNGEYTEAEALFRRCIQITGQQNAFYISEYIHFLLNDTGELENAKYINLRDFLQKNNKYPFFIQKYFFF